MGVHRILRVAFAVIALAAIAAQLLDLVDRGIFDPLHFFSYFTIQSNLIAVVALLWAAARNQAPSRTLDFFRGAATTYMVVVFIVFALLLSDTNVDTAIVWVDRVLHRLIPIVMVIDWLLDPPAANIALRRALWWIAYPLGYVVYSMIRGILTAKYPYPFLDPANGGYASVLIYSVGIALVVVVAIYAVVRIGDAMRNRSAPPPSAALAPR